MITVAQATEKIILRSRYLSEAMSKSLINTSALARYIRPEVEDLLQKKVSDAAILMAITRLSLSITKPPTFKNVFTSPPEMIFRSNLINLTVANTKALMEKYQQLLQLSDTNGKYFLTLTKGNFETSITTSNDLEEKMKILLQGERIVSRFQNLSSITITLPEEAMQTPAVFYFFLKSLAWEGINILELVSVREEFTLILEEKEVNKAFTILKSLFRN